MAWYIYSLTDPRTGERRYVGYSQNPARRLTFHLSQSPKVGWNPKKWNWICELKAEGMRPLCEILETGTGDWRDAERRWIASEKARGSRLLNIAPGGGKLDYNDNGGGNPITPEKAREMSLQRKTYGHGPGGNGRPRSTDRCPCGLETLNRCKVRGKSHKHAPSCPFYAGGCRVYVRKNQDAGSGWLF